MLLFETMDHYLLGFKMQTARDLSDRELLILKEFADYIVDAEKREEPMFGFDEKQGKMVVRGTMTRIK